MRLLVDILQPDGTKNGDGPLMAVKSARVRRLLDGAGTLTFEAPQSDKRAVELIRHKQRMAIYGEQAGKLRELGRGIIDGIDKNDDPQDRTISVTGPDILGELKYTSTLFARKYANTNLSDTVNGLVGIATEWGWAGWSATASGTDNLINARFDGVTVLKALQSLSQQQGLHLRLGASGKAIEVGLFGQGVGASEGDTKGLTLINIKDVPQAIYQNDDIGLIAGCRLNSTSEDVITWLLPVAGGQNVDSALTLQYSTRNGRYAIETMTGPDGRTLYFMRNTTAQAQFGIIPKVGTFKEISPLDNSDGGLRDASNALYDAGAATLDRYGEAQELYTLLVRKCSKTVRPGDKVKLQYTGLVELDNQVFKYREINGDFWVIEAAEYFGQEGFVLELKVSNIDRYMRDIEQVVIGGLEQIRIQGMSVQPSFSLSPYGPYQRSIDATHPVNVPLRIGDAFFGLNRCLLQIKSGPFRVNAKATTATAHNHSWASVLGTPNAGAGFANTTFSFTPDGVTFFLFNAQSNYNPALTTQVLAINENPPHFHELDYGIYDDTLYPQSLTVKVDGVTVASLLDISGAGLEFELDIAPQLNVNLRSLHTINITCLGGQGDLEVSFEMYPIITPFKLG